MPHVVWGSIATTGPMGQQRYETEIQEALSAMGEGWRFTARRVTSARSEISGAVRVPSRLNGVAPLRVSRLIGRLTYGQADLVHRFDLRLPAALGLEVVTVHDLPPLRFDDEGSLTRAAADSARRAQRIIAPSYFARSELQELLSVDHVDVVPYGVSDDYLYAPAATEAQLRRHGIRGPFVIHAAGASRRKNLMGLRDAWRHLLSRGDLQLVLCGPQDARRDDIFGDLPGVIKTGRLESMDVAGLMRRSAAVVVPSIYEGFGLPALEGMVCGVPVVAARRGAVPEVCGDAAVLTEPDGEALAEGIRRVLEDRKLNSLLRVAGPARAAAFSWKTAATEHLRIYSEVLA